MGKIVLLAMTVPVRTAIEKAVGINGTSSSVQGELTESLTDDVSSSSDDPSSARRSRLPKVMNFIGGDDNMWVKTLFVLLTAQLVIAILSSVGTSDFRDDVSP